MALPRAIPWYAAVGVQGTVNAYTLSTSPTQILGANPQRIALTFTCPTTGSAGGGSTTAVNKFLNQSTGLNIASVTDVLTLTASTGGAEMLGGTYNTVSGSITNVRMNVVSGAKRVFTTAVTLNNWFPIYMCANSGDSLTMSIDAATSWIGTMTMAALTFSGGGGGGASVAYIGFNSGISGAGAFPVYAGDNPFTLDYSQMGSNLWNPVYAYGGSASTPLTVVETIITPGLSPTSAIALTQSP